MMKVATFSIDLLKSFCASTECAHKIALAYHSHTIGQEEVSNKEIKTILEKTVNG